MRQGDRCLITGGAGFIGANLAYELLQRGMRVRILDNFSTGRRENLEGIADDIEIVEGDIRGIETVRHAVKDAPTIFHEAALPSVSRSIADPMTTHETNATGTLNVMIAARDAEAERIVFASSSSIYGDAERLPVDESMAPHPISPYAVSKLAGEGFLAAFHQAYGLATVALRYFNVFGPRQDPGSEYAAVVPRFAVAALRGRPVTIFGDGEQLRDFTYIGDVVQANMLAADAPPEARGRVFNIAGGDPRSVNDLLATIREIVPSDPQEPVHEPHRVGDVRSSHADISAAKDALGYTPASGFAEGVRRTVEWLAGRES